MRYITLIGWWAQKFFSHTDPDGHDQSDRAAAAGYNAVKEIKGGERIGVAENIAYIGTGNVAGYEYVNPTDPESIAKGIMTGWIKSPGHRANILDSLSNRIGVGTELQRRILVRNSGILLIRGDNVHHEYDRTGQERFLIWQIVIRHE